MPELGTRPENTVFVSGIGCSSRFPYYMNTYGVHSIHGRAPAIATGVAVARPDLDVWVITGDGDGLSIGGNHLIHALRRNVNLTILLFNNRIYGLTKGQYSPTSEPGKVTKSTPAGSVDEPFNPVSLALGAEATFVARTMDSDRKHLTSVLRQAAEHRGTALVEIYQNCPIFNDGAFDVLKDRDQAQARLVHLEHGQPIRFGPPGEDGLPSRGVVRAEDGTLRVVDLADGAAESNGAADGGPRLVVHDAHAADPSLAFALSRLDDRSMSHVPVGVFRSVARPTYDDLVREQVDSAVEAAGGPASDADLAALLAGSDTWTVA
jgi:2-oxoglutarate ferredoxin oxidoreductase subunit beta